MSPFSVFFGHDDLALLYCHLSKQRHLRPKRAIKTRRTVEEHDDVQEEPFSECSRSSDDRQKTTVLQKPNRYVWKLEHVVGLQPSQQRSRVAGGGVDVASSRSFNIVMEDVVAHSFKIVSYVMGKVWIVIGRFGRYQSLSRYWKRSFLDQGRTPDSRLLIPAFGGRKTGFSCSNQVGLECHLTCLRLRVAFSSPKPSSSSPTEGVCLPVLLQRSY